MKKMLSDYIKSEKDFRRFCNLFLKQEVPRLVKIYGADGRDGGIDAEYSGPYAGKSGRWIFQYKFRDLTKGIKQARDSFINDAKRELDKANKLQCDHYVLMTNVLLTPGNVGKIEDTKNEKEYSFSLICWDAENLITMTDKFPYILNSFRDSHLPVFLPWQDMFRDQIERKHKLLRYDYETFGREDELRQFQNFVRDPDKRLLTVYGSGGVGKTKLAIEFAKTVEQEHTDYEPLFVQMAGDSFENALADIPPNRKYIFFVDDAHDFIDNLGGIKIVLNSQGYSGSKAVLIARKPFKAALGGSFLAALPDDAVSELEIGRLSLEKTREFIGTYTRVVDGSLLAGLTQIGRDTPMLAVMVIDLVDKDIGLLKDLTKDKLIELTFESYLNDSFRKYPESGERRRKLLEWFSGIAPIDMENNQIRDKLAEILKVEPYEMEGISYFRPDDATDIFNIILDNPKEDYVKHYTGWTSTRTHQDVVKKIAKEVQKTVNTLSGFMKTLEIVRKLLLMKDLELPNHDSPQELLIGLTQTRLGKKADASDSASESVKREGAEARGPRRTDACCVSPNEYRLLTTVGASLRSLPK